MVQKNVKLAPAGAGVPWLERAVFKYFILPAQRKKGVPAQFESFMEATRTLAELAGNIKADAFHTPVLIKRPRGVEDSSRHWSMAQVMEHLMLVNEGVVRVMQELSQGRAPNMRISVADVKPVGRFDRMTRDESCAVFLRKAQESVEYLKSRNAGADTSASLRHPWFGPLNAVEWLCLMALHQHLHLHQARAIAARLS